MITRENVVFIREGGGVYQSLWYKRLDAIALFLFAAGTGFLTGKNQLRVLGLFMAVAFFLANSRKFLRDLSWLRPVPPELIFYTSWVVWVFLTGPLAAVDLQYFWAGGRVLAQMFVMVWIGYGILRAVKAGENAIFAGIILGAAVEIFLVISGVQSLEAIQSNPKHVERVEGLTDNPNSLGFIMVWCAASVLIFWKGQRAKFRLLWKILSFALIGACAYVLLATGSRKSSVAFVFVLWAWAAFALPEGAGKGARRVVLSFILGGVALWFFAAYGMEWAANTPVGIRWRQFLEKGGGSLAQGFEQNVRYDMYVEGVKIFLHHPIFGVGLNNFGKYFYTGQYSHSDYIEPLATTGLIGFVLYQAFYVLLFLRMVRLLKALRDPRTRYKIKMMLISLGAIMIIGFGAPHYTNQTVFLLLAAFSVYTWELERRTRFVRRRAPKAFLEPRLAFPRPVPRGGVLTGQRGNG